MPNADAMAAAELDDPAALGAAQASASPGWALARALMGGTPAMRRAGDIYLPRYEAEDMAAHQARIRRAVLLPAYEEAVRSIVGRVFAKPPVLADGLSPRLRGWLDNADLMGSGFDVLAMRWFTDALVTGIGWMQIEMPDADRPEADRRPYLIPLSAESVVAAYPEYRDGLWRLGHARIRFHTTERDGFREHVTERVHVLEPGQFATWFRDGGHWRAGAAGETGLGQVPLVPLILGEPIGSFCARPPLEGLAHLNVAHWQSASDQRNILTLGRFAMLALSGPAPGQDRGEVPVDGGLAVGPKTFLHSPDPAAKWYYVEPAGTAIQAGERDLDRLEAQMDRLALEPSLIRTGAGGRGLESGSATAAAIQAGRAHSAIQAWAQQLRDGLDSVIRIMAAWTGDRLPDPGDGTGLVSVNTDFTDLRNSADLDVLTTARSQGDLSRAAYLSELKRRGILSRGFSPDGDAAQCRREHDSEQDG